MAGDRPSPQKPSFRNQILIELYPGAFYYITALPGNNEMDFG